jgi:FkbM family methyltransferase
MSSDFYTDLKASSEGLRKVDLTSEVAIYGAGNTGRKVLKALRSLGIQPLCFLDEHSTRDEVEGVPVRRLADPGTPRVCMVVVAVFNRDPNASFEVISKRISEDGFGSACSFEEFYLSFPEHFAEEFFWLAPRSGILEKIELASTVEPLLGDAKSIEIFRATLKYRLTGCYSGFPQVGWDNQYFPEDVPLLSQPWRFLDLGAYDGDTLIAFRKNRIALESVFAFEPDLRNFNSLVRNSKEHGPFASGLVCLYPCGAGKACETISFASEGLESSHAVSAGQGNAANLTSITSLAVGDVIEGAHPNYIKMDIEGAEADALLGLKDVIVQEHPMLAISAYHRPFDLFDLPLMLRDFGVSYDFYFRLHGEHGFDTVLYAIPKKSAQ